MQLDELGGLGLDFRPAELAFEPGQPPVFLRQSFSRLGKASARSLKGCLERAWISLAVATRKASSAGASSNGARSVVAALAGVASRVSGSGSWRSAKSASAKASAFSSVSENFSKLSSSGLIEGAISYLLRRVCRGGLVPPLASLGRRLTMKPRQSTMER
jgi:hypothetical protein